MTAMLSVYISYRYSSSAEIADRVHRLLRERGVDVFFDRDLPLGTDYTVALPRELRKRDVLVVLLANDTHLSVNGVLPEIQQALDGGKRIIPVILPGFDFARDSHGTLIAQLEKIYGVRYNPRNPEGAADAIVQALTVTVEQQDGKTTVTVKAQAAPPVSPPPALAPAEKGGMSETARIAIITAIIAGVFALLAAIAPPLIERFFPPAPTVIVSGTPTAVGTAESTPSAAP